MKTLSILFALTVISSSAFAATYNCVPFKNDDTKPKDIDLPESFTLDIRGSQIEITAGSNTAKLVSDPFEKASQNSKDFDRYDAGKKIPRVLIAKAAASNPDHFTGKLEFEADGFHGIMGWHGYNCTPAKK